MKSAICHFSGKKPTCSVSSCKRDAVVLTHEVSHSICQHRDTAMLDRRLHHIHTHIVQISGESYRLKGKRNAEKPRRATNEEVNEQDCFPLRVVRVRSNGKRDYDPVANP